MKTENLTFEELIETNGGSEASDAFWRYVGYGIHKLWDLVSTSDDNSYVAAKVGV